MLYKILNTIGSQYSSEARPILAKLGQVDYFDLNQKQLLEKIGDYEVLLVGLGLNIDKAVIDRAANLKIIATATTGLDHIDVAYVESHGIKILSLRGETEFLDAITGTAELAWGLMIDLLRLTHQAAQDVKNYHWDRERFRGHNLYGQTLGIVGLGRLGRWMARYGQAFGMKVLACDPHVKQSDLAQMVSFEELIKQSDIVSIHVHLSPETTNMFHDKVFSQMKPTAYLINTARGQIVNEVDLLKALTDKTIAGYATDVLADELGFAEKFKKHPLIEYAKKHDNLLIVPHIGGMTHESRQATDIFIAEKIVKDLSIHGF